MFAMTPFVTLHNAKYCIFTGSKCLHSFWGAPILFSEIGFCIATCSYVCMYIYIYIYNYIYRVERGNLGYGVIWEIFLQTVCILRRIAEFS